MILDIFQVRVLVSCANMICRIQIKDFAITQGYQSSSSSNENCKPNKTVIWLTQPQSRSPGDSYMNSSLPFNPVQCKVIAHATFLHTFCIMEVHVSYGLPLSVAWLSLISLHFLTGVPCGLHFMCSNHLIRFSPIFSTIGATFAVSCIFSL